MVMGRRSGLLFFVFTFVFFLVGCEHGGVFMINKALFMALFLVSFVWCIYVVLLFLFGHQSRMELVWNLSTTHYLTKAIKHFWRFFICLVIMLRCCDVCVELKG